ncbi:helix-turn-helix domain-containing protein [Thiolinea disciformis]|uniref:helix-turn-helix domain-containing protein n=1 Tax=Thiolinea disciformis TaxID=125614 RepID=UPI0012FEFF49|nr:helix-turn-helix domain-containing protein [Thiolinea disciformis]
MNILRKNLIPNRISEICKAKNLNVKELAVEVGMAYSTFHNYASGRSEPKLDFFACMYDYDINLDWLITGEGQMFRGQSGTNQTVVTYGKGSTVVSTGVNHGHIVAEGKNTYVESRDGRAAVICDFVRAFASEHGADDVVWLEKQLERAVPEFRDWKEGK